MRPKKTKKKVPIECRKKLKLGNKIIIYTYNTHGNRKGERTLGH